MAPSNTNPDLEKQKIELKIQETEVDIIDFVHTIAWYKRFVLYAMLILLIPAYFIAKYAISTVYLADFSAAEIRAHPAIPGAAQDATVLSSAILPLTGQHYSAYALIKNPNNDLVQPDLSYAFNFKDGAGQIIQSVSDSTFLLGGEQKYIVVPNIILTTKPASVDVSITYGAWIKRISIPSVILQNGIGTHGDQANPDGFYLDDYFINQSAYRLGAVTATGIVFDKTGKLIAISQTVANTIQPNEQRAFHLYWPIPLESNVGSIKIQTETNLLDPTNLSLP